MPSAKKDAGGLGRKEGPKKAKAPVPTGRGSPPPLVPPDATKAMFKVGKYFLLETVGEGSFGKVKLGMHEDTGVRYAVKVMAKSRISTASLTMQVRREVAVMKALRHKNIVRLYEVLTSSKHIYLVMELVTGGELFDIISDRGRLSETVGRVYFQQLVCGIDYCWAGEDEDASVPTSSAVTTTSADATEEEEEDARRQRRKKVRAKKKRADAASGGAGVSSDLSADVQELVSSGGPDTLSPALSAASSAAGSDLPAASSAVAPPRASSVDASLIAAKAVLDRQQEDKKPKLAEMAGVARSTVSPHADEALSPAASITDIQSLRFFLPAEALHAVARNKNPMLSRLRGRTPGLPTVCATQGAPRFVLE
ncbi:hypothetical protein I4F81_007854 [Pyropia yezoensis]|uniref:Uncharacterized protein n=1 Tax=Pyropia yezoensis TaxID=2788 RepID=A0ACC3C4W0_PYRYE|nr:hypothetical protein I4F81_007854 [Neopyropia yezoensis]